MLKKVLFQNQDKTQLTIAVLGSIIGMLFLISSIHYLIRVNEFGKGEEILGPNTMIVQKKVSNSSSFNLTKTDFSVNEIERFKNEPFVADAQAVICNNFNVLLLTDDKFVPKFSSDVFLQTVNSKFLDVPADKWNWNEGDTIVPIVMPRDFLVMLNTFMSASGIPQVSEDLAKDIKFKLRISNEIKKDFVTAKIVGFTNEIPSLLVPETFMKYANQKYATVKETKITNVMISSKEGEFGKMEKFLEERGLESRKSQVVIGKLKSIVSTLFVVLLLISFVTVLVSSLVLIQYMQLLIATNQYQIRTLLRLGYNPRKIILLFTKYLGFTFGIVSVLALAIFLIEKILIDNLLEKGGITIGHSISPISMVSVFISFCIFVFISYLVARRKIMNEFFS
jgi:ABC-type antimicrobial peptide transport system permease subunit